MDEVDLTCHPNLLIELSYHYLRTNNFQELKQLLLDIEAFSTLFRSRTRILYLKFWHIIEVFGYEPIAEMVKQLESFEMHSGVDTEQMTILVVLYTLFFKELADFEGIRLKSFKEIGLSLKD